MVQAQNRGYVDNLHVGSQIIDHNRRRGGRRRRRRRFKDALKLSKVAGEREAGAEEERAGLEGPGGEGGDEAGGLERIFFAVAVVVVGVEGGEVGGDEEERVVLGAEVEEVVGLRLPLFDHAAARCALRYGTAGAGGSAPSLRR